MTLAYQDDFNAAVSISSTGVGATYGAHKPDGGDFSSIPFSDPTGTGNPFFQRDTYLRIRADATKNTSGLISSLHTDLSGFSTKYPCYFECRFIAPSAPGTWPAFWLLTYGTNLSTSRSSDELDIIEAYGGEGSGEPNATYLYQIASHTWNQPAGLPYIYQPGTNMATVGGGAGWMMTPHIYGCLVTATDTIYYLDNVETGRCTTTPVSKTDNFWFMVNLATGGGWPVDLSRYGGIADMYIDYVRVYNMPAATTNSSIGVQFVGLGTAAAATDSAGATAVAQNHWKTVTGANFSSVALTDNTGASTAATMSGGADGTYWSGSTFTSGSGNAKVASGELFDGDINTQTHSLTFSSIPYAQYDVYVYGACDAAGRNATFALTPTGGAASYKSLQTQSNASAWTESTNTWDGTGSAPTLPVANYVKFTGLTAGSFNLKFGGVGNVGLNGVQIVQTTPASYSGFGLQFVGSGTALAATDSAGVPAVAQAHWQSLTGATFSSLAIMDKNGSATTATLSGGADGSYWSGSAFTSGSANAKLASGELFDGDINSETHSLTVSSIPYGHYDVYVYAACDAAGRNATFALTPTGGSASYKSLQTQSNGSAWTESTNTWNGSGTAPSLPVANYVKFTGLTASSFNLKFGGVGNVGLDAIQVVQTGP
jgi:hypothetical protein